MVRTWKMDRGCADCGETDPIVLEFDHQHSKAHNVATMMHHSFETIIAEMEKCEVVCANCHRRRTDKTLWTR